MSSAATPLASWLDLRRADIESALDAFLLRPPRWPAVLHEAMHYSLLGGGKRLRPVLTLAAAEAVAAADDVRASGDRAHDDQTTHIGGARVPGDVRRAEDLTEPRAVTEARRLALPAACAIEMIHTYSLIHDDLPAMDDDSLRRGRPTSHVQFGEGMAILAGDGLLTEAFALLAREPADPAADIASRKLRTIAIVADAAGAAGMVGGQAIDLHAARPHAPRVPHGITPSEPAASGRAHAGAARARAANADVAATGRAAGADEPHSASGARESGAGPSAAFDADSLRDMHARKTGALIRAAAVAGAVMAGASPAAEAAVSSFATDLGLAFQIVDDILDVEGTAADLGKTAGKDAASGKPTYPALFGLDRSKQLARDAADRALGALAAAHLSGRLPDIARWVVDRRT